MKSSQNPYANITPEDEVEEESSTEVVPDDDEPLDNE